MKLLKRVRIIFKAFQNTQKSKATFKTAWSIFKTLGLEGFRTALINKASGAPLLEGLGTTLSENERRSNSQGIIFTTEWNIFQDQQNELSSTEIKDQISKQEKKFHFSFLMILDGCLIENLIETVKSIQSQYYENWDLWAIDVGERDGRSTAFINDISGKDVRIHLIKSEKTISKNALLNLALGNSTGDFISLIRPRDTLSQDALFWISKCIMENPELIMLYTDECYGNPNNNKDFLRYQFKPAWSPLTLIESNFPGNLSVFQKKWLENLGGFSEGFESCIDYELALRISEEKSKIIHLERVLYFNDSLFNDREIKEKEKKVRILALEEYLQRNDYKAYIYEKDGRLFISKWRNYVPKVSIIIITDEKERVISQIQTLLRDTAYPNYELVIVTNSALCDFIKSNYQHLGDRILLGRYDGLFNFAKKCNIGANLASGNYLIFLHDDALPSQRDWLQPILDALDLPNVGALSPSIISTTEKNSQFSYFYKKDDRYINDQVTHEVSILNRCCIATHRDIFFKVGGLNEIYTPNMYYDADFSFRITEEGLRCLYIASSTLFHSENLSWLKHITHDNSCVYILKKWSNKLLDDKFLPINIQESGNVFQLLLPEKLVEGEKGNILLISHELSRTGSPIVILEAAKILKNKGYFPIIASPTKGPLIEEIYAEGIPVVINESLSKYRAYPPEQVPDGINPSTDGFLLSFDLVLIASIVGHNLINCYRMSDIPILWWINESWTGFEILKKFLPYKLGNNQSVYCGGKLSQTVTTKMRPKYNPEVLLYSVKDRAILKKSKITEKVRFIFPATFEQRKNQSTLLEAISRLSPELVLKSDFMFIGMVGDEIYYQKLLQIAKNLSNVTFSGPVAYDKLMEIYSETECVVVPSIDDPMPVVLTEAMMLSKIVLCSDGTGTAEYIEDGINGFVFPSKDVSTLTQKLSYIIQNAANLDKLRASGRQTYEQYFSQKVFEENLIRAIEKHIMRFEEKCL